MTEQSKGATITQRCACLGDWGADPACKICSGVGTIEVPAPAYVLVPREPTREMITAGENAGYEADFGRTWVRPPADVYRAMIAASPPAPVDDDRLREIRERARFVPLVKDYGWEHVEDAAGDVSYLLDTIASLQARVGELEGERDSLRKRLDETALLGIEQVMVRAENRRRAEAAEAERDRLAGLLKECADDLAVEIENRYEGREDHPPLARRYERDMALVRKARAALKDTTHDQ